MKPSRRISIILVALLTCASVSPCLAHALSPAQYLESEFRRQLRAFPNGTEVRLQLATGKKLRGTIRALEDFELVVVTGKKTIRIPYWNLRGVEVKKAVFGDGESRRVDAGRAIR